MCLVDDAGNRLLNAEDAPKLTTWDAADTSALYEEAAAHCGIGQRDIEELIKNSEEIDVGLEDTA
jgi:hypothetical protein